MKVSLSVLVLALILVMGCTPKEPVEIGSACSSADQRIACAIGKQAICVGGKWQETMTCPGPEGCRRKNVGHGSTAPICDDALGRVGNVCDTWKGQICSEDRGSALVCEGSRWQLRKKCASGCSWNKDGIVCQ